MKVNTRLVDDLERVPGLAGCSRRELARLANLLSYGAVSEGDVLTRQDRVASQGYLILEGTASVRRDGTELGRLGPGDLVGEMALLHGMIRSATTVALTNMQLLVFDNDEFSRLMEEPPFAKLVARQLSDRLRGVDARSGTAG